jgi:hypothetical protein
MEFVWHRELAVDALSLSGLLPNLQLSILLAGLVGAVGVAPRTAHEQHVSPRTALPIVAFCAAFTTGLLWLYV